MAETSADLKRREEQLQQIIEKLVERMKLRQWAVERAIDAMHNDARSNLIGPEGQANVMTLAIQIHAFVTEPAHDALRQPSE